MKLLTTLDAREARYAAYAPTLIRLLVAVRLIWGSYDNVFFGARMAEFVQYLAAHGIPLPELSAVVSVYVQFVGGLLLAVGWQVRVAALVLVGNFCVAYFGVHVLSGDSFLDSYDALAMLLGSASLVLSGAGALGVDALRAKR